MTYELITTRVEGGQVGVITIVRTERFGRTF